MVQFLYAIVNWIHSVENTNWIINEVSVDSFNVRGLVAIWIIWILNGLHYKSTKWLRAKPLAKMSLSLSLSFFQFIYNLGI